MHELSERAINYAELIDVNEDPQEINEASVALEIVGIID